ncbi:MULTISPECIES: hypothetical protein [Streptomyces]|uniref:hypothetical protein n=1 Tax=Streptomyces TaxID=1883 RepID=UPI000B14B52D|nr:MULTISPECIES: hypothetical protein [Streptomyces]MBE4783953.1 hypothetical protein [Streptomyces caniscabiei]MBE4791548.1 hypothetical protein [Streptomyces caniscabiei]MDX3009215.1 hypothetical protein [Streptomyces caniscabiei]MDX3831349.1 hypothetical protein [Streptomyces europaeiscabiei]
MRTEALTIPVVSSSTVRDGCRRSGMMPVRTSAQVAIVSASSRDSDGRSLLRIARSYSNRLGM